jgi:DNA-binding NtrC family response regulator
MTDRIRLLFVDDEVDFLDAMTQRLEYRDFEVTMAKNGFEALKAANSQNLDIALIDLNMPGMNGIELLEALKRDHKYIEIIILTGYGNVDTAVKSTKLGAFDFLAKPCDFEQLIEKIASGSSPLGILRAMKKLDNEKK